MAITFDYILGVLRKEDQGSGGGGGPAGVGSWTAATPAVDYGGAPVGFQDLSYAKDDNTVYLSGILQRTGAGLTPTDSLLCNIPEGFRPAEEVVIPGSMGLSPATNNGISLIRFKANGDVTLTNVNFLNTNDVVRVEIKGIL